MILNSWASTPEVRKTSRFNHMLLLFLLRLPLKTVEISGRSEAYLQPGGKEGVGQQLLNKIG